ncbi:hypothetical protein V2J09_018691 [Rumex salicifolius]
MMINRGLSATSPEILHCFASTQEHQDMTQSSQQQQQQKYFNDFTMLYLLEEHPTQSVQGGLLLGSGDTILNEFTMTRPIKSDPGMDTGLDNYGVSRTTSCPPVDKMSKESFRKRKADNKTHLHSKVEAGDGNRAKKVKGSNETEELAPKKKDENNNNNSNSGNTKNGKKETKMKEDSPKESEAQKHDYIHVRARRGQATDSHSLAERVRREKISERMKYLQDLVPGCNKITGKAGMLDEIINYVQSLQRQVEFLSMKLATVSPSLDFNIEDLFAKEVFPVCSSNISAMEISNLAYLQYNPGQQIGPVCGSNLGMSEVEMGIRRTISAPVSVPESFPESSSLTQIQSCLPWEQTDLQGIYNMEFQHQLARQQSFPLQTYTGS